MFQVSRRWLVLTALAGGLTIVLGLTLAWLNIERMDLAYGLKRQQTRLQELEDHVAKLRVERDNLLAPYRLERLAREYGLKSPAGGQMRKVEQSHGPE